MRLIHNSGTDRVIDLELVFPVSLTLAIPDTL